MINIPRKQRKATLHINGQIVPSLGGKVTIYYQNEKECYEFESDILSIFLAYENDAHVYIAAKYICVNHDVRERLRELNTILSIFTADKIDMWIQEYDNKIVTVDKKAIRRLKKQKSSLIYWIEEINKLDAIQNHFGIHFYLLPINNPHESSILYNNVDIVYDSINMRPNMFAKGDRSKLFNNIVIDKPYKMKEDDTDFLEDKEIKIHNYLFIPHEVFIMPAKMLQRGKRNVSIEFCVTFIAQKIIEN